MRCCFLGGGESKEALSKFCSAGGRKSNEALSNAVIFTSWGVVNHRCSSQNYCFWSPGLRIKGSPWQNNCFLSQGLANQRNTLAKHLLLFPGALYMQGSPYQNKCFCLQLVLRTFTFLLQGDTGVILSREYGVYAAMLSARPLILERFRDKHQHLIVIYMSKQTYGIISSNSCHKKSHCAKSPRRAKRALTERRQAFQYLQVGPA